MELQGTDNCFPMLALVFAAMILELALNAAQLPLASKKMLNLD